MHRNFKTYTFMYNKINVVRHLETRECLNCGKEWSIYVNKKFTSSRRQLFCDKCSISLTEREKNEKWINGKWINGKYI